MSKANPGQGRKHMPKQDDDSSANPGPLDDISGQVTDLLTQVNDILGR